ncbi:Alpha/Beta hydrolase protein [Aspergillus desertorum]
MAHSIGNKLAFFTLWLATTALGTFAPYYADLTFQPARTLSNWSNLTVETHTGTFIGALNDTYPNVRQFLRVPFAKPPVGDLRWLPPQRLEKSSRRYDSTRAGPACPQYVSSSATNYNQYAPPNLLVNLGESLNQGAIAWSTSEDCLSLAVWTPSYADKTSKLPVALFVTGGHGLTGGIDIPSQVPEQWVSRSQEHIVVTINYRVNIFGNPKSRALNETSLSLLDVRAAVEWVSENIEAFGGDPKNIMLWGQSQGAALTHLYTLAFPSDPRVSKFGVLSQPPSVTVDLATTPDPYAGFDIVAKALGCNYGDDADAELDCMRQISWVQIEEFINRYNGSSQLDFSNYIPRYMAGKVAPGPEIRSNTASEMPTTNRTSTAETQRQWLCKGVEEAKLRYAYGLDTYRYLWAGNFSNISPEPWLGAFHWSDLLMIFGTYEKDAGAVPELEVQTSAAMQDFFLAFLKDPESLQRRGWPLFEPNAANGGVIMEFGKGTRARKIKGAYLDAGCYNSSVPMRLSG